MSIAVPPSSSPFPPGGPLHVAVSWVCTCLLMGGAALLCVYFNWSNWGLTLLIIAYTVWAAYGALVQLYELDRAFRQCNTDFELIKKHGLQSFLRMQVAEPSLLRKVLVCPKAQREAVRAAFAADIDVAIDQSRQAAARLPAMGLLGTVIGLSIMLFSFQGALGGSGHAVTEGLRQSLVGMGAAFYTTLAGSSGHFLVGGLVAAAEQSCDRLLTQVAAVVALIEAENP